LSLGTCRLLRPDSPALAKAEGMVRFYREGRRPLAEQAWPAVLGAEGERGIERGSGDES
jgi:hypothetical protein